MNVLEILPSDLHLDSLTELERDAISDVLRRDMELQHKESERLRILRAQISQLQLLSRESEAAGNQDKVCPLCHLEFGWLFHQGDLCPRCQTKVCDKCRQTGTTKHKWLCTLCYKQMELKTRSNSWFYTKFRRSRRRIQENGNSADGKDSPAPFTRKKAPSSADPCIITRMEPRKQSVDLKEQLLILTQGNRALEDVIFPKESDRKLLAELLAMNSSSSLSSPTEEGSFGEKSSFSSRKTTLYNQVVKSGDESPEVPCKSGLNAPSVRPRGSQKLHIGGFEDAQQDCTNSWSSSDCLRRSRDCGSLDVESGSSPSTDEEFDVNFQPKSKAVTGQVSLSAGRQVAEYTEHLYEMPVPQSPGPRSPSSPQEMQSIWFFPNPATNAAVVHMAESGGNLVDGKMRLECVTSANRANPEHCKHASAMKCTQKSNLNLIQNKTCKAEDETDSQDLLKSSYMKTNVHESGRRLGLNDVAKPEPESRAKHFTVCDEGDVENFLSVITEKTETDVDLNPSKNIVNSSDLFISDSEGDEWHKNMRGNLLLKDGWLASATDEQELDSFINQLAFDEIVFTVGCKLDPTFDTITENNWKILQLSSNKESVKFKTEKTANSRPSVENQVLCELEKDGMTYSMPNLDLCDIEQANTSSVESSQWTVSLPSKSNTQDYPVSDVKPYEIKNVLVEGENQSTSFESLSRKRDNLDLLQRSDSDVDVFKDSESIRTQQKLQSTGMSDSLSHLVSKEFALTGTPVDLEAEISASAAYNEVFLSERDRDLNLSEICGKQNWNRQKVVEKEHSKTCSESSVIATLLANQKIDLQLVKKQLEIGGRLSESSETFIPKCCSDAVQKKIMLQEVLKSHRNQTKNSNKVDKSLAALDSLRHEQRMTERFNQNACKVSFESVARHNVKGPAVLESPCENSRKASLTSSLNLTDFSQGKDVPVVSHILISNETDNKADSWNAVESSVLSLSDSHTSSNVAFVNGEMLHEVDREVAGSLFEKTIATEQHLSEKQGNSNFLDKTIEAKRINVSCLADKQAISQFERSEAEENFVLQGSGGFVANDQQLDLPPVHNTAILTAESDDTADDDLQTCSSVLLNAATIFVARNIQESVSPQINFAVISTMEIEMVSASDWIPETDDELVTATSSLVSGEVLSATSNSVQFCLAPLIVPQTEANTDGQLAAELAFPGESDSVKDRVSPVLVITHHAEDNEHENGEVVTDIQVATTTNSLKVQDTPSSKQSLSYIKATSQESVLSFYSNPGKSHVGKMAVIGEIELNIRYNDRSSALDVFVRQCRGLAAADAKKNRSDPYVKMYLLPNKSKSGKRKTAVKKNTLNPVYNEVLRYEIEEEELARHTLWVSVWHNDRFGHNEFLGDVVILLDYQTLSETEPQWYSLEQEAGVKWKSVLSLNSKADLDVSLKYVTADRTVSKMKGKRKPYGELLATVKMARNLSAIHGNNFSNPFCKCRLLPEQLHQSKQQTRVVKRSCNPTWNHTFVFTSVAQEDLQDYGLELTVWDHDRLRSRDFLGGIRLNLGSSAVRQPVEEWMDVTGDEVSLWRNMMIRPNEWIDATVSLRSYME